MSICKKQYRRSNVPQIRNLTTQIPSAKTIYIHNVALSRSNFSEAASEVTFLSLAFDGPNMDSLFAFRRTLATIHSPKIQLPNLVAMQIKVGIDWDIDVCKLLDKEEQEIIAKCLFSKTLSPRIESSFPSQVQVQMRISVTHESQWNDEMDQNWSECDEDVFKGFREACEKEIKEGNLFGGDQTRFLVVDVECDACFMCWD